MPPSASEGGQSATAGALRRRRAVDIRRGLGAFLGDQGLLVVIVVFGLVMTQLSDVFLTKANIINLLYQSTILAVFAVGMTFVVLTAGIDLSVGSIAALASVVATKVVLDQDIPPALGVALAILVGAGIGLINGLAVTKLGITPLIVTLATLSAGSGAAFAWTDGSNITPVPDFYKTVGTQEWLGVPVMIPFALAIALIAYIVLSRTRFGRSVYAVGGNAVAARLAGIRTDRVVTAVYVISGITAAIAGLMLTARLFSGSPRAGQGMELTVIAAVVIGGTSLFGGSGGIRGTLYGVLLITMVTNSINLLGVPSAYDDLITGAVIFVAAGLDVYRHRYFQRAMARRAEARAGPSPPDSGGQDRGVPKRPEGQTRGVST
jgi:ribose transport system permease protein